MNLTICPLCGPGSTPTQPWWSVSRDFSPAAHTLPARPEPVWQKMAQSPQ